MLAPGRNGLIALYAAMNRAWRCFWAAALLGCSDNTQLLDASFDAGPSTEPDVVDVALDRPEVADAATADVGEASTLDAPEVSPDVTGDGSSPDRPDAAQGDLGAEAAADVATDVTSTGDVMTDRPDGASSDAARDVAADVLPEPRGTPVIDGRIGDDWPASAREVRNTVASPWGGDLNALRALRVAWDDNRLYLGIDGAVEDTNAIAVYIDRDFVPGAAATGVTRIDRLSDGAGLLDDALSCAIMTLPDGFGVDMAWGTRGMRSKASADLVDGIGLRDIACSTCAADFRWVRGDDASCARTPSPACEVAIEWTALYGGSRPPPLPRIGLFVRITNGAGTDLSNNQSLPEQSPPAPGVVRAVLELSPSL